MSIEAEPAMNIMWLIIPPSRIIPVMISMIPIAVQSVGLVDSCLLFRCVMPKAMNPISRRAEPMLRSE